MDVFKIRTPCTVMLSGPSGCGKSTLVQEIIKRLSDVFDRPPTNVIYCYSRYQSLYDEMKKNSPVPMEFLEGLDEQLRPRPRTLLIIDDLQNSSKAIVDFFTKHSHHSDVDVIYLVQNLFLSTPHHRTCNLNTQILCVFKNPRDKLQITCLAKQIYPNNNKFLMDAYAQATKVAHGYLVLNLQQNTPEHLRLRDSFFPLQANFFIDKKPFKKTNLNIL